MEGKECDCAKSDHGELIADLLTNANTLFFMSKRQMDIHYEQISELKSDKHLVLSSVFEDEVLDKIKEVREIYSNKKKKIWTVPGGKHWVKGSDNAKKWCKENNLDFVELQSMQYIKVLETLAQAEGLCFLPAGADTCPRLVIEAKLLGCKLNLNDNVQHIEEDWFKTDDLEEIEKYLRGVHGRFWEHSSAQ